LLRLKEIQPSYEKTKSAVVCSAHFLHSDYTMCGNKKVLNINVIPSVFKETACKSLLRVFEDLPHNIENENQNNKEICILPTNEKPILTMTHRTADITNTELKTDFTNMSDRLQSTEVELLNDSICSSTSKELMSPTLITPVHLKRKCKRYMGDFHETDLNCPEKRKRYWQISQNTYSSLRQRNKLLRSQNLVMKREIKNFRQLINHLKYKNKIAENCFSVLKEILLPVQQEMVLKQLNLKTGREIFPDLSCFATPKDTTPKAKRIQRPTERAVKCFIDVQARDV